MSDSDGLADPLFKRGSAGRWLFFPAGILGRARILPDAETERRLRRRARAGLLASLAAVIALFVVLDVWVAAPLAVLVVAGFQLFLHAAVSAYPMSDDGLTLGELVRIAGDLGFRWLIPLAVLSFALLVGSAWVTLGTAGSDPLLGWLGILIFAPCLAVFVAQIRRVPI